MRQYERRATGAYPYYKLAEWDGQNLTWRDGRRAFATEAAARKTAKRPGRYRISEVTEAGRTDKEPFNAPR